jgi:hypothetical protein
VIKMQTKNPKLKTVPTKNKITKNISSKVSNKTNNTQKIESKPKSDQFVTKKTNTKQQNNKPTATKTQPTDQKEIKTNKLIHKISPTKTSGLLHKSSRGLQTNGNTTKTKTTKIGTTKSKTTKLSPQVGDLERKRKKEIPPAETVVKGEKINEVDVKGELVRDEAVERMGEIVQENTRQADKRKRTKESILPPGELIKGERVSDGVEVQGELVNEDAIERVGQVVKGDATSAHPVADLVCVYQGQGEEKRAGERGMK